jgi:hypothetical protein
VGSLDFWGSSCYDWARRGSGIMKKYRDVKKVLNEYFNQLEKDLPIEIKHFDYSILDKANLVLREIVQNLDRSTFKNKRFLFHYYLFFNLPFSKEHIIITIPVYVGEKVNTYKGNYHYVVKTKDVTVMLKNGNSSLFIVVFDLEVKSGLDNWKKLASVFKKISKKKNLELNSGKNGSTKFLALEIPVESYVFEYTAV